MKIIVTGSLGHISQPLATTLIEQKHEVVVISNKAERSAGIERLGARAAIGSLQDARFLTALFSNADAAYCMVPPDFSQKDQVAYYEQMGGAYAQAIRASGIRRVVHLSSYGAHLPSGTGFVVGSNRIEGLLNAIDRVSVTHIRPASFYYNLLSYLPMIKEIGFIGDVYGGTDRLLMVAPQDIAQTAARELVQTKDTAAVRYVYSDERSCDEIAAVLGNAIGLPDLQWKVLPRETVYNALVDHRVPEPAAALLVELGAAIHSGAIREDFDRHKIIPGTVKLVDFAPDFVRAYQQQ